MNQRPLRFDVDANALTDLGCIRTLNEDQARLVHVHDEAMLEERGVLLVVADGMGGHLAGEVASQIAVDTVHQTYYGAPGSPGEALVHAFEQANVAIYERSSRDPQLSGMGTTGTALVICGAQAFSANVGDSRIYLVRDGGIYRMTSDDSAVGEMVSKGLLTADEARKHAEKNVILRALGTSPDVVVSSWDPPFPVRDSDRFLLCSDGLHDLVETRRFNTPCLTERPPRRARSWCGLPGHVAARTTSRSWSRMSGRVSRPAPQRVRATRSHAR